jgi:hypothetical protein
MLLDPLHCYKNSFTLLEITIGQEKMHGRCVHHLFQFYCHSNFYLKRLQSDPCIFVVEP